MSEQKENNKKGEMISNKPDTSSTRGGTIILITLLVLFVVGYLDIEEVTRVIAPLGFIALSVGLLLWYQDRKTKNKNGKK